MHSDLARTVRMETSALIFPMVFHSKEVPNSVRPGSGVIHRTPTGIPPVLGVPTSDRSGQIAETSYENFHFAAAAHSDRPYLGHRQLVSPGTFGPYVWKTYGEVRTRVNRFAAGLIKLKLCPAITDPEINDRGVLGFYSHNIPEWVVAEHACFCYAIIPVPMYDTLTPELFSHIVNQVKGLRTVMCTVETLSKVIEAKSLCPRLTTVILANGVASAETQKKASAAGLTIILFSDVEAAAGDPSTFPRHAPPSPSDVCTFCYTSGTTGEAKGALITHSSFVSNLCFCFDKAFRKNNIQGCQSGMSFSNVPCVFLSAR